MIEKKLRQLMTPPPMRRARYDIDRAWGILEAVIRKYNQGPTERTEQELEDAIFRFRRACQASALAKWRGEAEPHQRKLRRLRQKDLTEESSGASALPLHPKREAPQ